MVHRLFVAALVALALLALTSCGPAGLRACGPAAGPGNAPQSSPGDTASSEETTPTPTSPPPADNATPLPTKEIPTPKPPLPTKPPLVTPEPSQTPFPSPPDGVQTCQQLTLFGPPEEVKYLDWCADQLLQHIKLICSDQTTTEAQTACGRNAVSEYRSLICCGIRPGNV